MNFQLLFYGLIEIIVSLFTGVIIFFISFKIFSIASKDIEEESEIKKNNIAVGIIIMAFVFSVMLLVKESVGLSKDALVNIFSTDKISASFVMFALLRILIIYVLSALFSIIIIWISILLFMFFTKKIEEMKEIKNNNTAVAILLGTLITSVALVLLQPLSTLLNSLAQPDSIIIQTKEPLINSYVMMNGLIELVISFFAVIFIFIISFIIFGLMTKNIDEMAELKSNNNAISILVSSFIFSMILLIKSAINPAYKAFEFAIEKKVAAGFIFLTIAQIVLYFIIAGIIAYIVLWLGMKCFMMFTKSIDEMSEIKKNNVAIALILAILLISTALLVSHGLEVLISSLVKTPPVDSSIINLQNLK